VGSFLGTPAEPTPTEATNSQPKRPYSLFESFLLTDNEDVAAEDEDGTVYSALSCV